MKPETRFVDIGFRMHLRVWQPSQPSSKRPILLVHGLASNAQTWDGVARALAEAGHLAIAIDQRGHGLSEKPPLEAGYDFATVTADLKRLLDKLGWHRPILAGQSWGGNVMLAFGARYPAVAAGFVYVDGGFLEVKQRAPIWEDAYELFKPPHFAGVSRATMQARMQQYQPDWSAEGIDGTLANFELLPDGTIRPWLTLDRHMTIFRAMWEQSPPKLYPLVQDPVLVCPAAGEQRDAAKAAQVQAAEAGLQHVETVWFDQTAHDIHVHRPKTLAETILNWEQRIEIGD